MPGTGLPLPGTWLPLPGTGLRSPGPGLRFTGHPGSRVVQRAEEGDGEGRRHAVEDGLIGLGEVRPDGPEGPPDELGGRGAANDAGIAGRMLAKVILPIALVERARIVIVAADVVAGIGISVRPWSVVRIWRPRGLSRSEPIPKLSINGLCALRTSPSQAATREI